MTRSSSSRSGTRCASRPARGEATRPGRRASRSSSSARPISATRRAKTRMAGATGGLTSTGVRTMFVFKAAVVGAGVMGGEIAQVIAAADVPVLLKDVDQELVDAGLAKARSVTEKQTSKLVEKGRL